MASWNVMSGVGRPYGTLAIEGKQSYITPHETKVIKGDVHNEHKGRVGVE
jgi:hypothetical protein